MNYNGLVYAAGPITGLSYDNATHWRHYLYNNLIKHKIIVLDPLRGKYYLKQEKEIKTSYERTIFSSAKGITSRDRWDVLRSDLLFVNFLGAEKVSIGTVMEIAWANLKDIPIILCMQKNNIHDHAMIKEVSNFVVESLDDGINVIKTLLFPYKL